MAVPVIKPIGPPTNVFSEGSYFDNAFTFCALFIHFLYYLSLILQAGAEELEINVFGEETSIIVCVSSYTDFSDSLIFLWYMYCEVMQILLSTRPAKILLLFILVCLINAKSFE